MALTHLDNVSRCALCYFLICALNGKESNCDGNRGYCYCFVLFSVIVILLLFSLKLVHVFKKIMFILACSSLSVPLKEDIENLSVNPIIMHGKC